MSGLATDVRELQQQLLASRQEIQDAQRRAQDAQRRAQEITSLAEQAVFSAIRRLRDAGWCVSSPQDMESISEMLGLLSECKRRMRALNAFVDRAFPHAQVVCSTHNRQEGSPRRADSAAVDCPRQHSSHTGSGSPDGCHDHHPMCNSTIDTSRFYETFLRFYGELVRIPPRAMLM